PRSRADRGAARTRSPHLHDGRRAREGGPDEHAELPRNPRPAPRPTRARVGREDAVRVQAAWWHDEVGAARSRAAVAARGDPRSARMNLAILTGHFPPGSFGGAELQAEGWAQHLAGRHQVTVITRDDPASGTLREERDGFSVLRLPVSAVPLWRTLADIAA